MSLFCVQVLQAMYLVLSYISQDTLAAKKLKVSVPINPVREDGLLSIYCQVWDLIPGEEVTIFRRRGQSDIERLTWNGGYAVGVEERVFIAERHVSDGSLVYFLTITNVEKRDQGDYTCRVFKSDTMEQIAFETLPVQIYHFPEEPDPLCSPHVDMTVQEGSVVTLNCTSREGLPRVQLSWSKSGSKTITPTRSGHSNGVVFSEISVRVTRHDNGAVFLCELNSLEFPDEARTCHVGPLKVLFTPHAPGDISNIPIKPLEATTMSSPGVKLNNLHNVDANEKTPGVKINTNYCSQECTLFDSPAFSWILLTAIAGAIAFLFFVIGLVLFLKLRMFNDEHRRHAIALKYAPKSSMRDDIYEELEGRQREARMYMALHLSDTSAKHPLQCGDLVVEKTHHTGAK